MGYDSTVFRLGLKSLGVGCTRAGAEYDIIPALSACDFGMASDIISPALTTSLCCLQVRLLQSTLRWLR